MLRQGKFLRGFYFAWMGISYTFRTQINFRVHSLIAIITFAFSIYLDLSTYEWLWIIAATGLVLIMELINTAIETLVDLVSPEFNPKAGLVKDISAAGVLIAAIVSLTIGFIIFLPKIFYAA